VKRGGNAWEGSAGFLFSYMPLFTGWKRRPVPEAGGDAGGFDQAPNPAPRFIEWILGALPRERNNPADSVAVAQLPGAVKMPEPSRPEPPSIVCPECRSEKCERVEALFRSGKSLSGGTTTAKGPAQEGAGDAASNRSAVDPARRAAMLAPPAKKAGKQHAMCCLLCFVLFVVGLAVEIPLVGLLQSAPGIYPVLYAAAALFPLAILVAFVWLLVRGRRFLRDDAQYNRDVWPALFERWQRRFICLTCGHDWECPSGTVPS
jgi:hypothetical protein